MARGGQFPKHIKIAAAFIVHTFGHRGGRDGGAVGQRLHNQVTALVDLLGLVGEGIQIQLFAQHPVTGALAADTA